MTHVDRIRQVRLVLVDADARERTSLERGVERHPRIELVGVGQTGREALQLASRLKPDVMVLDSALPGLDGLEAAGRVATAVPGVAVILMTSVDSVELMKDAMRRGVRSLLSKPVWIDDLVAAVLDAGAPLEHAIRPGMGRIWAIGGSKGASGSTTLAVNIAVALAGKQRVLLIDLDLADGDCAFYLDMPPCPAEDSVFGLLGGAEAPTASETERRIRRYPMPVGESQGLHLIDAVGRAAMLEEISEERVSSLLDMLCALYDVVIVDMPAGRLVEYPAALVADCAERLMLVSNTDIRSFKALAGLLRTFRAAGIPADKVEVLLNGLLPQPGFDAHGWLEERREELGSVFDIPVERERCARAVLRGIPVILDSPRATFSRFVREFAARQLEPEPVRPAARGWGWHGVLNRLHALLGGVP